jgi:hypothetical protein
MILGIPAYTVLRVFAREFFYGFKAVQKITSSLSEVDMPEKSRISNILTEESKKIVSKRRPGRKDVRKTED